MKVILVAGLTAALASVVVPLQAGAISGTFEGDSTLTPTANPGVFTQNFTGDGDDTTFGNFTPASTSTVDFSHPPNIVFSSGMLTETFDDGTLFGTTSGDGVANGAGAATFTIDFVITGGTGLFNEATGDATLTGTITSTSATTESITGTYTGSINVAPEPSTAILFGAGLAVVLVRQNFARRVVSGSAHHTAAGMRAGTA